MSQKTYQLILNYFYCFGGGDIHINLDFERYWIRTLWINLYWVTVWIINIRCWRRWESTWNWKKIFLLNLIMKDESMIRIEILAHGGGTETNWNVWLFHGWCSSTFYWNKVKVTLNQNFFLFEFTHTQLCLVYVHMSGNQSVLEKWDVMSILYFNSMDYSASFLYKSL